MSVQYVQHEYIVSQPYRPWTLDSSDSPSEGLMIDGGDEELLILDNSRLVFDEDYSEPDLCRCDNCAKRHLHSTHHNNEIAMISNGNIMDHIHEWTPHKPSETSLESSSSVPYKQLNGQTGHEADHHNHNHLHNHHHNGHTSDHNEHQLPSPDHNWPTHCHSTQSDARHTRALSKANRQLIIGCLLCLVFMITEFVGGFYSNSLAIMTDAAHLLSDLASFMLSLMAIWISRRKPTKRMSFGYHRAEVLGAVTSILMIWILTAVLVYLAVERIRDADYEIDSNAMLIVSGVGVVMNVVMGLTLSDSLCCKRVTDDSHGSDDHPHSHNSHSHSHASHGHSHTNMNVRAALIHVIGDLIQSIGVLIAALIIHFRPDYKISDPICTFIFSALVMFTTYGIMKEAVYVLMEGFPTYLDYSAVKKDLMDIEGVQTVHSLHIWSLTLNRNALSVHLATNVTSDAERVLKAAEALIRKKYDIQETTIQVERYDARAMDECLVCVGP